MDPLVSIVIPTKNGADTIEKCLSGIANQTYKNIEVVLIDSGSTDNTLLIASNYPFVKVFNILPTDFNHGLTRNYGLSVASGEFVVMTVQDAYPADKDWLERMLYHFVKPEVVGVCGQQIVPHDFDKNPHEWFRPVNGPTVKEVQFKNSKALSMAPKEMKEVCSWDNVNAMYRKSIFDNFPFDKVSFAEDMNWAKKVILSGQKVIYDTGSRVYHYHHGTYDFTYKRTLTVLYHTYIIFGYLRNFNYTWKDYLQIIYRNFRYKSSFKWIYFNWRIMKAREKASNDLKQKLAEGLQSLTAFHNKVCSTPPQGRQYE